MLLTAIVARFYFRDFAMLLYIVLLLTGLITNVRSLFALLSEVFVSADVAGSKDVVLAIGATPISLLNVPGVFVLRFVCRAWTVVTIVDVEVMLTSQILNDVVAIIER